MKKPIGINQESPLEKSQKENHNLAALCHQESAMLELQEAVSAILHRNVAHCCDTHAGVWYKAVSRRCGISSHSLKRFLEKGDSVGKAAKILHAFGYRIAKISVEKLPKK